MSYLERITKYSSGREKAVLGFVTGKGPLRKIRSTANAAYCEGRLFSKKRLKQAFEQSLFDDGAINRHVHHLIGEAEARPLFRILWDSANKAIAFDAWKKARKTNDFGVFAPKFQKIIDATRCVAEFKQASMGFASAYDARLDRLTPGMSVECADALIAEIMPYKDRLQSIPEQFRDDHKGVFSFPGSVQKDVVQKVMRALGLTKFNSELHDGEFHPLAFLLDEKVHLTFQSNPQDIVQTVLDVVHEAGHGLYRYHMGDTRRAHFLNMIDTSYNGPDEAAALFFEHYICRSPEFAEFLHGVIKDAAMNENLPCPSVRQIYRRLISDSGKLSRINATSTRYPFFLFQYHDIAKQLFSGDAQAADIPELWKQTSLKYHGRYVEDDVDQNELQDPHWCSGELGRFAAGYLPGLMMAAQIYKEMKHARPDAMGMVRTGDFTGVLDWAKKTIYWQNRRENFQDFIRNATGQSLSAQAFLDIELKRGNHPHACAKRPSTPRHAPVRIAA